MDDYRILLGALAVLVGFVGEALYLRDIFRGGIQPHPFSWFGWGLLDAVVFFAQTTKGAGAGSWVVGVAALVNIGIAVLSLKRGEKRIVASDWICFGGVLLGIVLWLLTNDPLSAVIIATVVNCIAFVPTFRKAFLRPQEESLNIFALDVVKFVLGIFALQAVSTTTILFPAVVAAANGIFVLTVLLRRRQLARIVQL